MASVSRNIVIGLLTGMGVAAAYKLAARKSGKYELAGKVALITGGSRGLGLVLARELAKRGCRLALFARDLGELERARAELIDSGADVIAVECDVTDRDDVEWAVGQVIHHFGRVDVLINDAGIIRMGPIELQTEQDFRDAMDTHFWASYYATMAVLPSMMKNGEGRIANIASIGGKVPVPHLSSYCASKFALVGFSSGIRAELLKYGIYVTTVCPGLMRTGSHINAEFKGQNEKEYAMFSSVGSSHLTSVSAEHAARSIVRSIVNGDAELIISLQAKLAAKLNAVFPQFTADVLAITARFLPSAEGGQMGSSTGLESRDLTPELLISNSDAASARNNELQPGETLH